MTFLIRSVAQTDSEAITRIYNHYIRESTITFEEQEITAETMASRIKEVADASLPWLVAEENGVVVGYAAAGKWKARSAYRFSVETTIYLDKQSAGKGIGKKLYGELLSTLKSSGVHSIIGGIALPNAASVALHESLGFVKVAHFNEVGFKFGRWIDVAYWQVSSQRLDEWLE